MLKGSELVHRVLITRDVGEKVGKVHDLIVDHEGSRVLGILADEKGWFSDAKIIRWPSVLSIGKDAGAASRKLVDGSKLGWRSHPDTDDTWWHSVEDGMGNRQEEQKLNPTHQKQKSQENPLSIRAPLLSSRFCVLRGDLAPRFLCGTPCKFLRCCAELLGLQNGHTPMFR